MSYGDYQYFQRQYGRVTKDLDIVAATDYSAGNGTSILAVKNANYTLFIQRITFAPTTYAAKTWTLQDNAGTPVPIGIISVPAAAPTTGGETDTFVFDFGGLGTALTEGVDLLLKMSAAGAAGRIHIEAYQKQTKALAAFPAAGVASTATSQ